MQTRLACARKYPTAARICTLLRECFTPTRCYSHVNVMVWWVRAGSGTFEQVWWHFESVRNAGFDLDDVLFTETDNLINRGDWEEEEEEEEDSEDEDEDEYDDYDGVQEEEEEEEDSEDEGVYDAYGNLLDE